MGAADVVPGVSGGTMALLLGIYPELLASLGALSDKALWQDAACLRWRSVLDRVNIRFLIPLGVGIGTALLVLARAVEAVLSRWPLQLWSFFCGLILGSVIVIAMDKVAWRLDRIILVLASLATVWVCMGLAPAATPTTPWFLLLCGWLAVGAMLLPGVSGSWVLVMMGQYGPVLAAVNNQELDIVMVVLAGGAMGLVTVSKALLWLYRRWTQPMLAVLVGIMAGSVRRIWPWNSADAPSSGKAGPDILGLTIPDITPEYAASTEFVTVCAAALAGLALVYILARSSAASEVSQLEQPR
jgi:putative membrane protein